MRCTTSVIAWIAILLFSGSVQLCAQTQPSQGANSSTKENGNGVYRVGGGVSPPRVTYSPNPEYSEKARSTGYQGVCVLWLIVGTDGVPHDIKVTRPLGLGLDEKAIEAVRQWRFSPAMKDGVPVPVQINVEVSFRLFGFSGSKFQKLFEKADAGDAKAQYELSQAFLSGHDLPKNESQGFAYLEKAANQGLPKAQFEMGEYVFSHKNDLVTAYVWYALAQRSRYKNSDKKVRELAKKMTPEQLAEARRRADSNNPF